MSTLLIVGLSLAGLVFIMVILSNAKRLKTVTKRLPLTFILFILVFGLLGLTGFMLNEGIADSPFMLGSLLLLASLAGGTSITYNLYQKWEWSRNARLWKRVGYLLGITLASVAIFTLVFLLCEHGGRLRGVGRQADIIWPLACLIFSMLLPIIMKVLHELWLAIPRFANVRPYFQLPVGASSPFIETGGASLNFAFSIPLDYRSKDVIQSEVAVPLNIPLQEAFHYKLHDNNVVQRYAKKIVIAENNKRTKMYGWSFYQPKKIWWGLWTTKEYLDPTRRVGYQVQNKAVIYVERVKSWEN